jgi:hypothetical protein
MDQKHSPRWPWPSPPSWQAGHSTEVEHRITVLEITGTNQGRFNDKVKTRLSRLEKIILAIVAALNILAHDKLPDWAKGMSLILKAVMG